MPRYISKKLILALIIMMMAPLFPLNNTVPKAEAADVCVLPTVEGSFPDPQFRECVSRSFGRNGSIICTNDLLRTTLTDASCQHVGEFEWIENITGIQLLTNLQNVQLYGNSISDLTPMQNLTTITNLDLHNNNITDISKLSNLTNLTDLYLQNEQTSFFGDIYLFNNAIEDLTPLANMDDLGTLYLGGNQISDLSGLAGKPLLTDLNLKNNKLTDSSLSGINWGTLPSLLILDLSSYPAMFNLFESNVITDLSPLNDLPSGLTTLNLDITGITDLSTLNWGNLTSLTSTALNGNYYTDISPLSSANPDFANGNTIQIMYNGLSQDQATYTDAVADVATLEGNGATVVHDLSFEICDNLTDDDGDGNTDGDDSYCFPTTAYIDFGFRPGPDCGMTIGNPCSSFTELSNESWFQAMTMEPPYSEVIINVKGELPEDDFPQLLSAYFAATNVTIQGWPGEPLPRMHDTLLILGALNTTIKNMMFLDNDEWPGLVLVGGQNSVIENIGAGNMDAGIIIGFGKNVTVQNNILVGNTGIFQTSFFGFPMDTPICGGILVAGSNDTKIINNTMVNNCDEFNFVDDPSAPVAKLADLTLASLSFLPASSSKNTTVKQNLVYNDLTALPPSVNPYAYYIDPANDESVNGVPVTFPLTDDSAADHGEGNNFLEKITDPFVNLGGGDPADYALNPLTVADFQTCTISSDTPPLDILGNTRPSGPVEGGAVESSGGSCGGGGSQAAPICSSIPVKIDLPKELPVFYNDEGNPAVQLNWLKPEIEDINTDNKIDILFEYLNQTQSPVIGVNSNRLKNIFARYMFEEINKSISPTLGELFKTNLKYYTDRQTDVVVNMLKGIGIERVFSDWWPYLAVYTLKNHRFADKLFTSSLKQAMLVLSSNLTTSNESLSIFDTWLKFISQFGSTLIRDLSAAESKNENLTSAVQCIKKVIGVPLSYEDDIYNPFEAKAISTGTMQTQLGTLLERISKENRLKAQAALDKIVKDGRLESILKSISSDLNLIKATMATLGTGFSNLHSVWEDNSAIRSLVDFYQTDKNFYEYKNILFESSYFRGIESCIETNFRQALIDLLKTVRYEVVYDMLAKSDTCSDDVTDLIMDISTNMRTTYEGKIATDSMILNFLNDLLNMEKLLASTSTADVATPFTDFYNAKLALAKVQIMEGIDTQIYRDSKLIETLDNPNLTSYVDNDIPLNNTGRIRDHSYYLITKTSCDEAVGSSGTAQINPQIKAGTSVDVYLDLGIIVKEGYSQMFMDRLQEMLQKAAQHTAQALSATFTGAASTNEGVAEEGINEGACLQAKVDLLGNNLTGYTVLDYVLKCMAPTEDMVYKLTQQKDNFIPPLVIKLKNTPKEEMEAAIIHFMEPIINKINQIIDAEQYVMEGISSLAYLTDPLLLKNSLEDFSSDEKALIKCLGGPTCDQATIDLVEDFLMGASHAANVIIEKYGKDGTLIASYPAKTDIFGEAKDIYLEKFISGDEYTLKIRLDGESYVLPKVSKLVINSATPTSSGFRADVTLKYDSAFQYGNFDNSGDSKDVIDVKDMTAWLNLLNDHPELWDQGNVNGLYGIDLSDAVTILKNWGSARQVGIGEGGISLTELAEIFGISLTTETPTNLSDLQKTVTEEFRSITAPKWLYMINICPANN